MGCGYPLNLPLVGGVIIPLWVVGGISGSPELFWVALEPSGMVWMSLDSSEVFIH